MKRFSIILEHLRDYSLGILSLLAFVFPVMQPLKQRTASSAHKGKWRTKPVSAVVQYMPRF